MDISALKKTLAKELAKDLPCTSIIRNKLDIKMYSLIHGIDTVITLAIPKAKLSPKSISKFDKECEEIQIKEKKLKKIRKKKKTEKSQEDFRTAQAEKSQVIAKAKRKTYYKSRKKACAFSKNMQKAVKHVQNWILRQLCLSNI